MFTCRNQSCGADWKLSDVNIHNEGQGLLFRCPMCGARNYVTRRQTKDGETTYAQVTEFPPNGKR